MNARISIAACALGMLSAAANCEQCNPASDPRKGNLDRAADAVLVTRADGHTLAVVSNPELQHLRVLDLTIESFVEAPNGFFPLSIPVGADTRRLAVAVTAAGGLDEARVFALDGAIDEVFVIDTATLAAVSSVATGRAPADIAAFVGEAGGTGEDVELWITLPDEGVVEVLGLDGVAIERIQLPDVDGVAARPGDIVIDPLGESIVVADAAQPLVHVFSREDHALDRSLVVGGSVGALSAGVVDIGDGLAPVVVALLRDQPVAAVVRLFRAGVPEDRYALLGSVEVPGRPTTAYVPDHRETATVCCRELSNDAVDAGEATDAWAAVGTADGAIVYISLGATDGLVRLVDNDVEPLGAGEPIEGGWVPEAGDEDREPVVALEATGAFGDPPFVPLFDTDEQVTLVWEGALPGLFRIGGTWDGGASAFVANTTSLEERGALAGDLAILSLEDPGTGCESELEAVIDAVQDTDVRLPLTDEEEACVIGAGALRISVAPFEAFVAESRDGDFLGRVAPGDELVLRGAVLSVAPGAGGPPQHRGSTLLVPLDAHVAVVDLDLADAPSLLASDGGGFGQAGFLPVAIVGRELDFPGVELGTVITGRRMVIATASQDSSGLNVIFTCDEAETVPGLCLSFR